MNSPFQSLPPQLTFDQYLAKLEEWAARSELAQCLSTLKRFYVTGCTLEQTVEWLKQRESILAEPAESVDTEEYRDRGEGFGA